MKKVTGKRFLAYLLDIIFVLVVSSLFASITFLNPKLEEYNEIYDEYMEAYEEYTEDLLKGDNTEIKTLEAKINDLTYDVAKTSVYVTLINIICLVLYFALFQYYNKGQTLGKRLLKIRVVTTNTEELKFWQVLVRSLIINSIFVSTVTLILLVILPKAQFNNYSSVIQWIDIAFIYGSIGFMIFRQDGRGIHDLIACTNVRPDNEESEEILEEKKETIKVIKTQRKNTTKKTSTGTATKTPAKKTSNIRTVKAKEKK